MAKARRSFKSSLKPRNPLALHPLMGKGGAHQRKDKQASRARFKERLHHLLEHME